MMRRGRARRERQTKSNFVPLIIAAFIVVSAAIYFLSSSEPAATLENPTVTPLTPVQNLRSDPSWQLSREISGALFSETPPTQELLNSLLKKLYFSQEKFAASGDIHNLMGRLFLYKIHMDRQERLFAKESLQQWQEHASNHFRKALALYQRGELRPAMKLAVKPWMPERPLYQGPIILYSTPQQASKDIEKILQNYSRFLSQK